MFTSLERYIPLFQAYLNAKEPQSFLQSLNDPAQRKILQILTDDIHSVRDYEKKMKEFSLNPTLARELLSLKLTNYLQNAKELKDDEIWNQIKIRFGSNNFDFSRPQALSANDPAGQKQDLTPSRLQVKQTLQSYLNEKLSKRPDFIRNLNDYAISRVKDDVLLSLPLSEKDYLLEKCGIIYHFQKKFIAEFLRLYQNQKRKENPAYRLNSKILLNLTKEQINYLGESNKKLFDNEDYIQLWFNLNYSERIMKHIEDSQYFSKVQHLNKRDEFIKIVSELSKINHSIIKAYINKFKAEIMLQDLIVGDPVIERLIQYLHNNNSAYRLRELNSEYKVQATKKLRDNQASRFEPKMRYVLQIDKQQPDQLVEDYLEKLFKFNNKDRSYLERLNVFFNRDYLLKLNAKATLLLGEKQQGIDQNFSPDQLRSMKEQKSIKLHATNKRNYRPNDDVQIEVSIKNIDRIDIKIYELSLEKHYLTQTGQIQDDINLSFLKPAVQYIYTNQAAKQNPFKVVDAVIKIQEDKIPKKMGVFIVDLQGDTITSRAIIRKGAILCLQSYTEAGQQFSFYDQGGRPLTHKDGLKIWVKGKPKALKQNTNYFFMDYIEKSQWLTIIASIENYAEMYQKELKAEQYKFQVGYLYNPESFIVGKKAKVVLHGRLSMNNCSMSLQLLNNIKVKVTVTNNLKISTYYSFNIDKWLDREDPFIQFPIQSYTSSINISIEAKILLQSQKQTTVSHYKQIPIDLQENQPNFIDIYLQKNRQESYVLNVLGQNGQKIGHTDVILSYSINGVEELQKTKVKTDANGTVQLGKLLIVKQLSAEITAYKTTVSRLWQLDKADAGLNYSNVIHVKVGQEISLPIDPKWTQKDFVLLRTFDKYYAEDISKQIRTYNGRITLPTINKQGYYILKILPIEKVIQVLTLKNYKWQGDTDQNQKVYDQFHGKIYDINKNLYQNINIQAITQENLEGRTKIHLALNMADLKEQKYKYVRVHAFATNYVAPEFHQAFTPEAFNLQDQLNQYYFHKKNSAYFSNKILSDEGAYVWKRQRQNERIVGNNLQKPGIFLKRALVRQTNQEDEDLDYQDRYIQECAMVNVNPNLRQRVNPKRKEKAENNIGKVSYLNSHNNFLALSGQVLNNLNGQKITFQIPNNYNNVQLFILTPRTAIKKTISLGHTQSKKYKDLRHVGMVDTQNSKGWTMSRQVYELNVDKEMTISRNSLWRTVTLPDIYQFANAKRYNLYDWSSHLLNWFRYNQAKKKQIYDKQCCHELNAFLYFQDRQFFCKIVKPFISNKISKNFVDLCLIGDQNIKQFAKIEKLSKLNAFEKVLLVHSLVEQKQNEVAENITRMLKLQQDSVKKNYQQFKVNFDTMINSKVGEQKEGRLKSARAKMEQMKPRRGREYEQQQLMYNQSACYQEEQMEERAQRRFEKKQAFVPVESTKQYTQRTYYNVKNYKAEAPTLVDSSSFWAKLAEHLLTGKTTDFLSKQFMSLRTNVDFILAACFISAQSSANFELQTCGQNYKITAKCPMLLYVKQVKEVEFAQKFGVQINQRFIDPQNMHTYEDGLQIERQVEEFIVKKPYNAQTVVTNTSGTPLQLQILLDIPKGAIPLHSHEYTEIVNIVLRQYTSQVYKRAFYLPSEGEFPIYPSNACRGSTIIAKALPKPKLVVKKYLTINKFQSFDDILRSGDKKKIIQFIKTSNIFDGKIFDPISILWMLKDKEFYQQVTQILRERRYYNQNIWIFAFYHKDLPAIKEAINYNVADKGIFEPTIFEYFPYYSSRTHQFANQTKSTIRNVQFKESYIQFLVSSVVGIQDQAIYGVTLAYYLILQDRLKEADAILKKLAAQFPQKHKIQVDYMRCFLDMSLNAPNFEVAREIMNNYKDYPIESWKKLFDEVKNSLQAQDNDYPQENQYKRSEEYQTQVIQQIGQFKIIQPADTTIIVEFFQVNLQVFFSEYPFYDYKAFTAVKPSYLKSYPSSPQTKEIIVKRKDFPKIRDATVEITEAKQGLPPKKVSTFQWANAEMKVKFSENVGTLQVFINKKKSPGAYVKVFSKKSYLESFYRDGYTDMTGTFRYAMSDLEGISQFSILVLTQKGGIIQKVKPPSKLASY